MAERPIKHVGFKGAMAHVGPGYNPGAVIAAAAQKASPEAIARNPRLKRVHGAGSKYRAAKPNRYFGRRGA